MDIDKLTELAQRIMQVTDTERRYKAAENLQQKIVEDIGVVISACSDLIRENATLRWSDYLYLRKILFIHDDRTPERCIYLLTNYLSDIEEYEADTEEKRAERQQKLKEYREIRDLPPEKVIYNCNVRAGITKVIRKISPDLIYCQHGLYRQYSELCRTFEYRLCRKIQGSNSGDLKTLYQKVCLYIALKNERAMMSEELVLLGVDVQADKKATGKQEKAGLKKPTDAKPHYSNSDRDAAKSQYDNLIKGGYMPSETPLSDWLYIYGADNTKPNSEPLKWLKTQSELGCLVQCIWGDTDPTRMWEICKNVFILTDGKRPNPDAMATLCSKINTSTKDKPKSHCKLEELLKI